MRFWDSSAIVPLLVAEAERERIISYLEGDPLMLVWWGTPVEVFSAIARQEREGALLLKESASALAQLDALSASWQEVQPHERLRGTAQRLLRVHPLRSADALQLAAAITVAHALNSRPEFVCLDARLSEAALREGFRVLE